MTSCGRRLRPGLRWAMCSKCGRPPHRKGFDFRQYGESKRHLVDFEGIALVVIKKKPKKKEGGVQKNEES